MKRLELSLIFISSIHLCSAQEISFAHNMYRGGDVLIKKMVSPVDPGSTGNKKVWSLEDVTIEQKKYKQAFKDNPDDIHSIKSTESGNRNYDIKRYPRKVRTPSSWENNWNTNGIHTDSYYIWIFKTQIT